MMKIIWMIISNAKNVVLYVRIVLGHNQIVQAVYIKINTCLQITVV